MLLMLIVPDSLERATLVCDAPWVELYRGARGGVAKRFAAESPVRSSVMARIVSRVFTSIGVLRRSGKRIRLHLKAV